jgi:hypothetical protein
MKIKYNKAILGLVFVAALTSCKKDYLNTSPTESVSTELALGTTANLTAAVNGIHRMMFSQTLGTQVQGGQSGNMLYIDILAEDVVFNSQSSTWLLNDYKWIAHRNPSAAINLYHYQFYFSIIGNANNILANVDAASGADADKRAIRGQALTYRAWAYFQMVQLFGERFVAGGANSSLAVPLVLAPTTTSTPRSTVAQVYTQINTDIDAAIVNLAGYTRPNKSNFNVAVAQGIKARIALTQQNWAVAAESARAARTGISLMNNSSQTSPEYLNGFNNYENAEWMWGSRIISDQTNYFYSFFANMGANYNSTVNRVSQKSINSALYNTISATDVRKRVWDPTGRNTVDFVIPTAASVRFPYMSRKFKVADVNFSTGDVPYMRAAEMYLIEAEALARSGNNAGAAAALLPLAVNRDPQYRSSTNTGAALITEIMNQRRVELWGEGFRFYDLKRTNSALDRTGANHNSTFTNGVNSVAANDIRWQFLIPQDEIVNSNGVVVQNPQ